MEEVYLYFRDCATNALDDDKGTSCLFPLSAYAGMEFSSASGVNSVTLFFRSMLNNFGYDETADNEVVSDSVLIDLKTTATARQFRRDFHEAIDSAKMKLRGKFLVIGDNNAEATSDDGNTGTQYFSTTVDHIEAITIVAANAE